MVYNLTNISMANDTVQLISRINIDLTGGALGLVFVLIIMSILFIYNSEKYTVMSSLLLSTVLTTIISGFMFFAGLVSLNILIMLVVFTALLVAATVLLD